MRAAALLLATAVLAAACASVTVQTGTGGAVITDEDIKGGVVVKPREKPPTLEKK